MTNPNTVIPRRRLRRIVLHLRIVTRRLLFLCLIIPWGLLMAAVGVLAFVMLFVNAGLQWLVDDRDSDYWSWPENLTDAMERGAKVISKLLSRPQNVRGEAREALPPTSGSAS